MQRHLQTLCSLIEQNQSNEGKVRNITAIGKASSQLCFSASHLLWEGWRCYQKSANKPNSLTEVYNNLLFWTVTACVLATLGSQEEQQNKGWFTEADLEPSRAETPPYFHDSMWVLGDVGNSGPSFTILLVLQEHLFRVHRNCTWPVTRAGRWSTVMGTCWKLEAGYQLKPLNQTHLESHMLPAQAVRRNRLSAQSPVQLPHMAMEMEPDGALEKHLFFLTMLLSSGSLIKPPVHAEFGNRWGHS